MAADELTRLAAERRRLLRRLRALDRRLLELIAGRGAAESRRAGSGALAVTVLSMMPETRHGASRRAGAGAGRIGAAR